MHRRTGIDFDMSSRPRISCVIVNYETSDVVARCIKSLTEQTIAADLEILVVDNPSPAGDVENLRHLPTIKIVENSVNVGYGLGCNAGERAASGELICVLNPDTYLSPTAMENWRNAFLELLAKQPTAAMLAPKLLNDNGSAQRSVYRFLTWRNYWLYHSILAGVLKKMRKNVALGSDDKYNTLVFEPCDWVMGSAMLVRRSDWQAVDGFCPEFFMYAEDQDFCLRLHQAGRTVWFTPCVSVYHTQGEPSAANRDKGILRFYDGLSTLLFLRHSPGNRRLIQVQVLADMVLRCLALLVIIPFSFGNRLIMVNRFKGYCGVFSHYFREFFKKER